MALDLHNKIVVSEAADGFSIYVNDYRFWKNQEDDCSILVEMFKYLGYVDVSYEEDY